VRFFSPRTNSKKVVVAYSAGKNSLWNMWWAQEKFGTENVLAVHINGLNRANASRERMYAERQREKLGFNNFKVIRWANMISGSFTRDFQRACKQYNISFSSVS
jgi:tRNA(Ile)-lysidine synthase TilS/MesJ